MSILKIARMGHPVLGGRAVEVESPQDPEIRRLIADMEETLADIGGLGLAAPQVHVPLRVIVFHGPGGEGEGPEFTVLINPTWEPLSEVRGFGWEGCLSVPGLRGLVPRYREIRYSGITPAGGTVTREAAGRYAVVVQHECDHLDGILYPMRMTDMSRLVFESELTRHFALEAERHEAEELEFEEEEADAETD